MEDDNIVKINTADAGNWTLLSPYNTITISTQTIATCDIPKGNPEPKELVPMVCKRCGGKIKNMKCESCDTEYEWR